MARRLIEEAFPLKTVSTDSKHDKNVRHGHISTLHVWPARRPLAACRAVAIATLLPDPADASDAMKKEYEELSGSPLPDKQREYLCKLIESLTRWGNENGHGDWDARDQQGHRVNKLRIARELILKAYNGRPPKVLDMFAGGGAIPLEAMRLGCEVTANDYNPVAWFILKCTLEYPQRFAGKSLPFPSLNLDETSDLGKGDLADHVRLWGQWVLKNARKELHPYYPGVGNKPTVAYFWARTIPCQDPMCGGTIPLLKTLWVCTKPEKILEDTPENQDRPDFLRIQRTKRTSKVIINSKRALKFCRDLETKQIRFEVFTPEKTEDVGKGTMTGATATCPFCGSQQPDDYIKRCGREGKLKAQMTTVVYQETYGKEYCAPTKKQVKAAERSGRTLESIANQIPNIIPDEPLPSKKRHRAVGSQLPDYGFKTWSNLFSDRQLLALLVFVKWTRAAQEEMKSCGYSHEWKEAISGYLACVINRMLAFNSTLVAWISSVEAVGHTFVRYAFSFTWDYSEAAIPNEVRGGYQLCLDKILSSLDTISCAHAAKSSECVILHQSATNPINSKADVIITDPPYYDAIPYADISDFFYVWLRRLIGISSPEFSEDELTPKQDELVQQHKTGEGGKLGKERFEKGMAASFQTAHDSLCNEGRMVIVFAHKDPDAWETLVGAMIECGLVVTTSWPIDTEQGARMSAQGTAALATSLWLVCRKRPATAKAGHYGKVKREMQERITERLRYFWDAGIQGPDFVWAAIGPGLESYSSYKEVRRHTGEPFTVSAFLTEVRRMVTDFALGKILSGASTEALDDWTRYYLMHKNYFGAGYAPVGECILLAQGYGVLLSDLTATRHGILKKASSGSALRLQSHADRRTDRVGQPHATGELPIIDMLHRVMNLWEAGERGQINAYLARHGLRENSLFKSVIQALIEMSPQGSNERSLLETIINYKPNPRASGNKSNPAVSDESPQYFIKGIEP